MLECAYPNRFHNAVKRYQADHIHANTGTASTQYNHTSALLKVVEGACDPVKSEAGFVYDKLLPYIRSRYQFMKTNKRRCCRKLTKQK